MNCLGGDVVGYLECHVFSGSGVKSHNGDDDVGGGGCDDEGIHLQSHS